MAGLGDLLQRIARSLEEAGAQQPGDDLRARLGYGTGDDDEDELAEDAVWEPEPETARAPGTARTAPTSRTPGPVQAPAPGTLRTSPAHRAPFPEVVPRDRRPSPTAPPHAHARPESLLSERIRARLRTPDALREAFVVKEVLDRPLGRRRRR